MTPRSAQAKLKIQIHDKPSALKLFRSQPGFFAVARLPFVTFVTLSPIGLRAVVAGIKIEHFAAFLTIGVLFDLGFPDRLIYAAIIVIGAAIALEAMETLYPDSMDALSMSMLRSLVQF